MKKAVVSLFILYSFLFVQPSCAQPLSQKKIFTRQDTLRGSLTPQRAWWNVLKYNIAVTPDYVSKTIKGQNTITYYDSGIGHTMQIDLQQPMQIDSIKGENKSYKFTREGNVYWVYVRDSLVKYRIQPGPRDITIYFHGQPKEAVRAPWDGGWIWAKDAKGRPWMSVACQGLGASVWYPCKDVQSDEPDNGAILSITVTDTLVAVGNGRLKNKTSTKGFSTYTWEVKNPINSYNIVPYIGHYTNWKETYKGEKGFLDCSYWVLDYNLEKAKKQFVQAPQMLKAFEYWFGPYPFYDDSYKLVEAPHLGMEHQSAVAYGNHYQNGYLGKDLSGTGWGLKWDFIIVHESGHEWFANNITTNDIADMWVHEGFTNYSETLFTDFYFGTAAGNAYCIGTRKNIQNDIPIIGLYGVNQEGSGDMYYKGGNLLHTIRNIINNDTLFRSIVKGLNTTFYHQTVTSKQVEDYISEESKKDFSKVFDQYLRTVKIPVLELSLNKGVLSYRWTNCVAGFNMPVKLTTNQWLYPSTEWKKTKWTGKDIQKVEVDKNFYITTKKSASTKEI